MDARRKADIEAKKQKLADLKKARLERQATLTSNSTERSGRSTPGGSVTDRERGVSSRAQLDELVSSLLGGSGTISPRDNSKSTSARIPLDRSTSGRTSRLSETTTSDRDRDRDAAPDASVTGTPGHISASGPAGSVASDAVPSLETSPGPNAAIAQSISTSNTPVVPLHTQPPTAFPPKPQVVTYDKAIQTLSLHDNGAGNGSDDEDDDADLLQAKTAVATEAEIRARILKELEVQRDIDRLEAEELKKQAERKQNESLPRSDVDTIFSSPEFQSFLNSSSKILERALNDDYDYVQDYTIGDGDATATDKGTNVQPVCAFYDPKWCRNRSVTAVDWSPRFPELSVAAYNKNPESGTDPDGIVAVWNLHLVERPEFVFHAQSDVLSVAFSPFHPNLVIGGTYAGQILIWDTRAKALPVIKSPLSAAGHTHPVYSLSLVGTQNAHNLISASTDGTICSWTLDMLARPQETLELLHPQHAKTDEVSITSMAFQGNETTTLLVGTEEGNIYAANRYDRAGAKAGLVQGDSYRAHSGPVLGLDHHPLAGPIDFSDLFLSCGVDWTVRLWRSKAAASHTTVSAAPARAAPPTAVHGGISPIHTFEEASDFVMNARWHPIHPALFGTVDASGKFNIWNINMDTEVPYASTQVSSQGQRRGLNKLAWDKRDGKHAAVGSSDGKLYIYDIGNLATPREHEWDLMRRTLNGFGSAEMVGR